MGLQQKAFFQFRLHFLACDIILQLRICFFFDSLFDCLASAGFIVLLEFETQNLLERAFTEK